MSPLGRVGQGSSEVSAFELSNALEPEHVFDKKRRRKRFSINGYLLATGAFLVVLWYLYVYHLPLWETAWNEWISPKSTRWRVDHDSSQRVFLRTVQFLAIGWFFYFGACIGSFFNVVAWRWPNGRGIVFGGSKCPYCNNRLGFIHNTPILGWMWCRGKCAFCKLPIATRYLWMEIAFGAVFAILVVRQVTTGGTNLPNWQMVLPGGFENTVFTPQWMLIAAYLQHAFVFASLIMLMGSTADSLRFPWRGWFVFLLLISVPKIIWPELEFVRWSDGTSLSSADLVPKFLDNLQQLIPVQNVSPILTWLLGGVAGWCMAMATGVFLPESNNNIGYRHWVMCGTLLGFVFGWQTVLVNLVLGLFAALLVRFLSNRTSIQWVWCLIALAMVSFTHHLIWRQVAALVYG